MKKLIQKIALASLLSLLAPLTTTAQGIYGNWWYDANLGLELSLKPTAKKGNNIRNENDVCNGSLAVSEDYIYIMNLSFKLQQTVSNREAVFSVWGTDSCFSSEYSMKKEDRPVKGTVRVKLVGNRLLITGTDSKGAKWPFSGYYLQKTPN